MSASTLRLGLGRTCNRWWIESRHRTVCNLGGSDRRRFNNRCDDGKIRNDDQSGRKVVKSGRATAANAVG